MEVFIHKAVNDSLVFRICPGGVRLPLFRCPFLQGFTLVYQGQHFLVWFPPFLKYPFPFRLILFFKIHAYEFPGLFHTVPAL